MKIGLVCPYNLALGGAVQEIVKESATELKRRGHEVVVISPRPQQGEMYENGHRIVYVGKAVDSKSFGTVVQLSISTRPGEIEEMLEREQFDILHMHEPWIPLLNSQILSRSNCPVVATFHAKLPDSTAAKALTAFGKPYTSPPLKYIDALVAVSEPAAEHLRSVTDRDITIIPNAVNLRQYRAPKQASVSNGQTKRLLYVGRLEERKGVKYLIRAFHLLNQTHPDTELLIAGDGVQRKRLELLARRLGARNVKFLGYVTDAEKKELMQTADLFCAPAVFGESFGIVIIEAMASGQVLIVGNNEGYKSVMRELGQISVIDPHDAVNFSERMELLLYDEKLRTIWREWAMDYVKRFDYRQIMGLYEKLYEQLLKEERYYDRSDEEF